MRIFRLPDVGEGLREAEIVEWLVAAGDEVDAGQPVVLVETDKAQVEVTSPRGGRIARCIGAPGDVVAVGAPLLECAASRGCARHPPCGRARGSSAST
jgi:pyruvate dehydrogenase E2 component (dihydrolipoamide acetyltransferase)